MKRSNIKVMQRLVGMVRPLAGFMIIAIIMGVLGNLFASFITVLGVLGVGSIMGFFDLSLKKLIILMMKEDN